MPSLVTITPSSSAPPTRIPVKPDYWYTRSGSMPSDFWLMSNTGEIQWGDPQIGTYTFTVYVEGPGWSEGSRAYTIVVDPELIFTPTHCLTPAKTLPIISPSLFQAELSRTPQPAKRHFAAGIDFIDPAFTGTRPPLVSILILSYRLWMVLVSPKPITFP